jgi:hypothetical protein
MSHTIPNAERSNAEGRVGTDKEASMRTRTLALLALSIGSAACGTAAQLSPAPEAAVAPVGPGEGAVASDAGVQVEVRSRAWSGEPVKLETAVTPLFVVVTNRSNRPVLVRYRSIALMQGGLAYPALSPNDVDETVTDDYVYPDYGHYWGGWSSYRYIELPTRDMVLMALPEGVLAPGEKIEGFLYFEDLDDDITDVEFQMQLVDPAARKAFGLIEIPFVAY